MSRHIEIPIATIVGCLVCLFGLPATAQLEQSYDTNGSAICIGRGPYNWGWQARKIIIPDKINGLPVTAIGSGAFTGYGTNLTTVVIPASVKSIAGPVFHWTPSLMEIIVDPANPAYCSVDGVLFNKQKTELIELPGGREDYAMPDTVTVIRGMAFSGCTKLTNVTISTRVTTIGGGAFWGCDKLASVTIPASVTNIGVRVADATALSVVASNPVYSSVDGVLFNKPKTRLLEFPRGRTGRYVIPETVTTIGREAFDDSGRLAGVTIPNGVTTIEREAFRGCWSLATITIPATVTSIGDRAFFGCGGLSGIYFLGNAPSAGGGVFIQHVGREGAFMDEVTVYYLPGTTGWGKTFCDRPTAIWKQPEGATGDAPPSTKK